MMRVPVCPECGHAESFHTPTFGCSYRHAGTRVTPPRPCSCSRDDAALRLKRLRSFTIVHDRR